jgi:isopentenyldiphosphate isomerase
VREWALFWLDEEEELDWVGKSDNVIGVNPRGECLTRGLLHRAVLVFVINSKKEIFLQRRSKQAVFLSELLDSIFARAM